MSNCRVVILDDDYNALQALSNASKKIGVDSYLYNNASSFYSDLEQKKFSYNDVFILDLMLRNEGLPSEILDDDAQTGQVMLRELRKTLPLSIIYVVTAWNLRDDDPHGTIENSNRLFYKPCKYREVIKEILRDYNNKMGTN